MILDKPVSNPMLVGCIELMKDEDTPERRRMLAEELEKSRLQIPIVFEKEPVQDEEGNWVSVPGSRTQFPMLNTPDGKFFFMGFTDPVELRKWTERNRVLHSCVFTFDDIARLFFMPTENGQQCPALGLIINPLGSHVVIPREMIAGILANRMGYNNMFQASMQARAARAAAGEPDDDDENLDDEANE